MVADPYSYLSFLDRLQALAFEAELAYLPRSLIAAIWEAFDRFQGMAWRPSDEHDREIRQWMAARRWGVTRTHYDFDREIYAWRHQVPGGTSPTLRISRRVVEDYPPFIVVHHLEELKVPSAIRQRPEALLVVVQDGARVALREIPPK